MRPHLSANCTKTGRRGWWRGEEGARRPGPEAQVLRHVLWHVLHSTLRRVLHVLVLHVSPRAGVVGGGEVASGSRRSTPFFCPLKGCVRRVLYVLALHVPTATVTGPAAPTRASNAQRARDDKETVVDRVRVAAQQHFFFGFRRSKMTRATTNTFKMTRATINTFTLPSFAAPEFRRMKMTRATTSTKAVVAAAVVVTNPARGGEDGGRVMIMKKPFAWV